MPSSFKTTGLGPQIEKDPQSVLDFTVDWSTWMGADTISTSVWTVPTGLTAGSASNTTTKATQWISGGAAGQTYAVSNKITTAGGRTDRRQFLIKCKDR